MRHYPTSGPPAAARTVALALVADGHVSRTELDMLDRLGACGQLGIPPEEMHSLVQNFCEDLLQARHSHWGGAGQIEPEILNQPCPLGKSVVMLPEHPCIDLIDAAA